MYIIMSFCKAKFTPEFSKIKYLKISKYIYIFKVSSRSKLLFKNRGRNTEYNEVF